MLLQFSSMKAECIISQNYPKLYLAKQQSQEKSNSNFFHSILILDYYPFINK